MVHVDKKKTLRLLNTVKGQIEGLSKMIENDRDCIDISNQILASQSILKKINMDILKGHFEHCIKESFEKGSRAESEEKIKEVIEVLSKLIK